jgi:hypothetical protein
VGGPAYGALWSLLDESAAAHLSVPGPLDVHQQPEQVRAIASEAQLVVDEPLRRHFKR